MAITSSCGRPIAIVGVDAGHPGQGAIEDGDALRAVQNQHAVGARFDDGVQALLLAQGLPVQLRVVHGDGGLIGKRLQHLPIVGREDVAVAAKDVDQPDEIVADHHRDGDGLPQAEVAAARDERHLPIELRHEPVPGAIALGRIGPQRSEEGQHAAAGCREWRAA